METTITCSSCHRKIDVIRQAEGFVIPVHLNYMKTADCEASGKYYGEKYVDLYPSYPPEIIAALLTIFNRKF